MGAIWWTNVQRRYNARACDTYNWRSFMTWNFYRGCVRSCNVTWQWFVAGDLCVWQASTHFTRTCLTRGSPCCATRTSIACSVSANSSMLCRWFMPRTAPSLKRFLLAYLLIYHIVQPYSSLSTRVLPCDNNKCCILVSLLWHCWLERHHDPLSFKVLLLLALLPFNGCFSTWSWPRIMWKNSH